MNNLRTLLVAMVAGLAAVSADIASASDLYTCNELSGDIAGFFGSRNKYGGSDSAWGTAAGVNYFFTENLGTGLDSYADAFNLPYLLNANAIFRYPIGETPFAPYAF